MKLTTVTVAASACTVALCNNINGWTGCPTDDLTKKNQINQAYKDALTLASNVNPFRGIQHDELFTATSWEFDTLGDRFFGTQSTWNSDKGGFTKSVINTIAQWYPWWFFDYWWGKRIEVRCVDSENRCKTVGDQEVGAYASNTDKGPIITFCEPFWKLPNLADRKKILDETPDWRKDIGNFKTQGQIFLHEMTHLLVISGDKHIIDYKWEEGSARAYGPKRAAILARQSDKKNTWDSALNADSYAMLASGAYFQKFYGVPDAKMTTQDLDNNNPTSVDQNGGDFDDPIDEGRWGNVAAYPASIGYAPDEAQVTDMVNWAKTALPPLSTSSSASVPPTQAPSSVAPAPVTTSAAAPMSSVAPLPPTCTPDVECSDRVPIRCRCVGCTCSDGSRTGCNVNGNCVK